MPPITGSFVALDTKYFISNKISLKIIKEIITSVKEVSENVEKMRDFCFLGYRKDFCLSKIHNQTFSICIDFYRGLCYTKEKRKER